MKNSLSPHTHGIVRSITKRDMNNGVLTRQPKLTEVKPGLTPRLFPAPEDQPRHVRICPPRYINVTPIIPGIPVIYGTPTSDVRACALSPSGWGTCQKYSTK